MSEGYQPTRPFRFLIERAGGDIENARQLRSDPNGIDELIKGAFSESTLELDSADVDVLLRYLKDPNAKLRIAAFVMMEKVAMPNVEIAGYCFTVAFGDADSTVRGFAWQMIGQLWNSNESTKGILEIARRYLIARFGITPEAISDLVTRIWLDGIAQLWRSSQRVSQTEQMHQRVVQFETELIRRRSGSDFDRLRSDPELAKSFLHHVDPDRRVAAIMVLRKYGIMEKPLLETIEIIMSADPEPRVRITALSYYIHFYRKSKDPHATRALARIVCDESNLYEMRDGSYQGLFQIRDEPVISWPITRVGLGEFTFPDDIDWEFIRKCSQVERE